MPRPVGSKNLVGKKVKASILAVFEDLGGQAAMTEWARENKDEFYRMYARLIPTEITGSIEIRDASELSDSELVAIIAEASGAGAAESSAGEGVAPKVH